jgi:amino acid transporter
MYSTGRATSSPASSSRSLPLSSQRSALRFQRPVLSICKLTRRRGFPVSILTSSSWAAEAGGPRYGRLFGFIVAWWSTTAWTTFIASNSQSAANFLLSEITVFNLNFPTDTTNIKFRAVQWIVSEIILCLSIGLCYVSPRTFSRVFRISVGVIMLDFFLNLIWLPIAVSKTYGFQSAEFVFTQTFNETGAPPVWNWMLSYFVTAGVLVGFEASGHISEETQNASVTAARGIFSSAIASAVLGFPLVILFLFCMPSLETLFGFTGPQPFIGLYVLTLGKGGHIFMNVICILGLILVSYYTVTPPILSLTLHRTPLLPELLPHVSYGPSLVMVSYLIPAGSPRSLRRRNPEMPSS